MRLQLVRADFQSADGLARAFTALSQQRAEAVVVQPDPISFNQRVRIAEIAASYKLPAIYGFAEVVDAGGLMSYAPSTTVLWRGAARYVES